MFFRSKHNKIEPVAIEMNELESQVDLTRIILPEITFNAANITFRNETGSGLNGTNLRNSIFMQQSYDSVPSVSLKVENF